MEQDKIHNILSINYSNYHKELKFRQYFFQKEHRKKN